MQIVVTGAAGFIGSHLCQRLLENGSEVIGIDNFDLFYSPKLKKLNLKNCLDDKNFRLVETDIRDSVSIEPVVAGADMIIHLAAKAGVRPSIQDPMLYQDVNIRGTMVLLEAAKKADIKKFIFASSSSVYGNNEKIPFSETDNVDNPISPYAATKKAGELICHTYWHLYGININCLRLFTVYGPRQRPDLAIHKFARLIEAQKPIPFYGDGSMMRDFTYIDDIIGGIVGAMNHWRGYEIYNLGESVPVRLDVLISELEKALGKKADIKRLPKQPGDVDRTFADIDKAKKLLGYNPKTNLASGLKTFVQWLRTEASSVDY